MKYWIKITFVFIILTLGVGYYFRADLNNWYRSAQTELETGIIQIKETSQIIITPPPLRGPTKEIVSNLSVAGTISETNVRRAQNGLPALSVNTALTAAAQTKVNDMFDRQYFAHESPTGAGPGELAYNAGYEYFIVGENLALGNYKDDKDLLDAWMNSPGHRENILHSRYTEIGVAVKRGIYEGQMTWLAVQEFGRPAPNCPLPDKTLNAQIEKNKILLTDLENQLENKNNELKNIKPKRGPAYNQKVEEYNELARQYNKLLDETKTLISDYNNQVQIYNLCIENA